MKYEYLKGSEKDFEGAPAWAMVAIKCSGFDNIDFATSLKNGEICYYTDYKKEHLITQAERWQVIAERQPITEPVWDATTPPPVGIECEVLFTSEGSIFERAIILHVGVDGIVGRWLTGDSSGGLFDYMYVPHDYRPIIPGVKLEG